MSGDQLVFDMSSSPEQGQASVFVRKDWLSIQDSNNGSYVSNNIIIETSMLSNSNRYISYRDSFILMPLLITMTAPAATGWNPTDPAHSADNVISLKNFYGSIIHSLQIDMNGSTISQTVPYIGLYNAFKLLTTLSYQDCISQGPSIGFYMDTSTSVGFSPADDVNGVGVTNNRNGAGFALVTFSLAPTGIPYNEGFFKRQSMWNFDPQALLPGNDTPYTDLISVASLTQVWKSYIFNKVRANGAQSGIWQCAITAQIYLKHISDFFAKIPLLKGCFFRLSIFINQPTVSFIAANGELTETTVNSPLGGVSTLMVASAMPQFQGTAPSASSTLVDGPYTVSLCVGNVCLNTAQSGLARVGLGPLCKNVQLICPSYVFNPVFESAYISSEIKHISYESQYNYNVMAIPTNTSFVQNLTNGIANIKSLLFIPVYSPASNGGLTTFQSPFDPCGGGPTSPFCYLGNFQAQISGANVLYNQGQYIYQQFLQQTQGVNAVNAGETDGLTSGMISKVDWETSYCYWFLDCSRMLPVEEAVPKSVSVSGLNLSTKSIDIYCFVTYGVSIDVSVLSGARV